MMDTPGRALIVTVGRARGALAAARALDAAGWTVGIGTPDGAGMVTASRACTRAHVVARPRGDGADFVAGVRTAVADGGYDVVFGGADDWMAALAHHRDDIPAAVAHPPTHVVAAALDKVGLTRRADAVGLRSPRTAFASDAELEAWGGPVVVKCRAHWEPGQTQRHRIEARRYADAGAARPRVHLIRDAGLDAVLQEPVDGQLSALIGLVHEGQLIGRVQQETSRLWPTPSGVSARAVTIPIEPELADRAARLLGELGWSGLVELQFLTDAQGQRHLIDLNGRFYGSMALANASGPNLADAWGRQVLGLPLPPLPDGRAGVRFAWAAGDLRRAFVERRGGRLADVRDTVRWARTATKSVWDRGDLGPTRELVTSRLRRATSASDRDAAPERPRSGTGQPTPGADARPGGGPRTSRSGA